MGIDEWLTMWNIKKKPAVWFSRVRECQHKTIIIIVIMMSCLVNW